MSERLHLHAKMEIPVESREEFFALYSAVLTVAKLTDRLLAPNSAERANTEVMRAMWGAFQNNGIVNDYWEWTKAQGKR